MDSCPVEVSLPVRLGVRVSHQEGGLAQEKELPKCTWRTDGTLRREAGVLRRVEYTRKHEIPGEHARNPLASVARFTEHGIIVQFDSKNDENFILNPQN